MIALAIEIIPRAKGILHKDSSYIRKDSDGKESLDKVLQKMDF